MNFPAFRIGIPAVGNMEILIEGRPPRRSRARNSFGPGSAASDHSASLVLKLKGILTASASGAISGQLEQVRAVVINGILY
jgi:hypothetical protein